MRSALAAAAMLVVGATPDARADYRSCERAINLAALNGNVEAQLCRADIAEDMTAREIAEAQRRQSPTRHREILSRDGGADRQECLDERRLHAREASN